MSKKKKTRKPSMGKRSVKWWFLVIGIAGCALIILGGNKFLEYTSTDEFCMRCHIHPGSDQSWMMSTHHSSKSGVITHCYECHLPPKGHGYLYHKAKTGIKDIYGYFFKDSAAIDWDKKQLLEYSKKIVFEESCVRCHQDLYPLTLSENGGDAHLSYDNSLHTDNPLNCLNCHIDVGHYDPNSIGHTHNIDFGVTVVTDEPDYEEATRVTSFENYTEKIPGTHVSFNMKAIPGGTFKMGSPADEPFRDDDEGPVRDITVSRFFMAETEVTWDEYMAFFRATGSQGRMEGQVSKNVVADAISGATPPWGAPDQGWGKGQRPAITMSWHAANVYCRWLSQVTGKTYRLPTEAEWEYACRAGTETPYYFDGNPKKFSSKGFMKKIFKPDTSLIASNVIYAGNSSGKTAEPSAVNANPFGLKNMLGNVAEFCYDRYSETFYTDTVSVNPKGPVRGYPEHVIRGGSFKSDASDVRSANRDFTKTKAWLITDPQIPKSIWWYSDCIDVGFRVVCEVDSTMCF